MRFYVDENITPNIAQALAILQNPRSNENMEVLTIKDEFRISCLCQCMETLKRVQGDGRAGLGDPETSSG
jgi:hypothetical protein